MYQCGKCSYRDRLTVTLCNLQLHAVSKCIFKWGGNDVESGEIIWTGVEGVMRDVEDERRIRMCRGQDKVGMEE
jgi:hypothetical protein